MNQSVIAITTLLIFWGVSAQADYYSEARGLTGYRLKSTLKMIISRSHKSKSYGSLYRFYAEGDIDRTYDNDGKILDIYSENPESTDPYNFQPSRRCGNYRGEADCYNREHLFPQSIFDKALPMRSDYFHVIPTDGYVNNRRGSFPFGEVGRRPKWISQNGSKLGANTTKGYRGMVFEPIDEFKGDVARAMLYFATRYEDRIAGWRHEMLNGTSQQVYKTWFLNVLLSWHKLDPVSDHERQRNDAGETFQGNRNPFIDHPEFVEMIWN